MYTHRFNTDKPSTNTCTAGSVGDHAPHIMFKLPNNLILVTRVHGTCACNHTVIHHNQSSGGIFSYNTSFRQTCPWKWISRYVCACKNSIYGVSMCAFVSMHTRLPCALVSVSTCCSLDREDLRKGTMTSLKRSPCKWIPEGGSICLRVSICPCSAHLCMCQYWR